MTLLPVGAETIEDMRRMAEEEFEKGTPAPEPPKPITLPRPAVIQIGEARAWLEIVVPTRTYNRADDAKVKFFLVATQGSQNTRFDGELAEAEIDALIDQLNAAKRGLAAKQKFFIADEVHRKAQESWNKRRGEHTREIEQKWQQTNKKK